MNFSAVDSRTVVGRLARLPLTIIPKGAVMRVVQGPLRGKRWIAGSSDHGCWLGSYEHKKQIMFRKLVKTGATVYDLGANAGYYSLLASVLVGPSGYVYSFEPLPQNLRYLKEHLQLNRVANCYVFDCAVSSSAGAAKFEASKGLSMGHLGTQGIDVLTAALDELLEQGQIRPPDVIKCDIEGGEYDALLGSQRTIAKHHPVIFLATHGAEVRDRCRSLLSSLNYQLQPLDGERFEMASEFLASAITA